MQHVTASEEGLLFLFKCISLYNGSTLFFLLYIVLLVFIALKGSAEFKRIFLYPSIVMLFTVYNPLMPVFINHFFDINKEYYRFMWITPVVILLSLSAADLLMKSGRKPISRCLIFSGLILIFIGSGSFVYDDGYVLKENIYKVPDEVIQVSEIIRENTDMDYPVAIMDLKMHMEIRQYDASILLSCDRSQYLDFLDRAVEDDLMQEKNKYVNRLLSVIVRHEEINKEDFREALNETNTQFVVVEKLSPVIRYLTDTGLKPAGTTNNRIILKFDLDNPVYYELADYSGL